MKRRKGLFSKVLVVFIVLMNTAFTAAVLWVFFRTSQEPAVLIGAWFGFTTGELWLAAKIKREKIEKEGIVNDQLEAEAEQPETLDADHHLDD